MDRSADRRMRAKAQFRSELPLPVRQAELDPTKLSEVAGLLGPIHICPALVEKRLLEIATQYRHSRKLERDRVTRPVANKCLHEVHQQARWICEQLDRLTKDCHAALEFELDGLAPMPCHPGQESLEISAHVFEQLALAADFVSTRGENITNKTDLRAIQKSADLLAQMVSSLPSDAEWALVLMQQYTWSSYPPDCTFRGLTFLRDLARWLELTTAAAFEASKFDRGPKSDTALTRTVQDLRLLYETATGAGVSHFTRNGRLYVGMARSHFGKFASSAVNLIDPELRTKRGINDAISYAVWPSRAAHRALEVQRQTQLREHRILEILIGLRVTNFSPQP